LKEPDGAVEAPEGVVIAALAKALGHPARIGIVAMLHQRQTCIGCDIVEEIGLAQSTTSEHLRILKAAGIITGEIERPRVCYSLNPDSLLPLAGLLNSLFDKGGQDALDGAACRPPPGGKTMKSSNS
jgi:ArsR family transcriptional regulator